ncbi:alkaline phosphatase [Massilia norwichensis]|uniref:Alkaline phosphatase n=1 Tax=Massilia norwichensis TaxID=1442366 RepID=A0ABT2A323_9BURK|nr:alkaline phosphatase [Massilia norwichensis]MCS0588574.1 alkaline phosphatase [Massilia norwichensis]
MRSTTFAAGVLMACGAATLTGCATPPPTAAGTPQARSIDKVSERARNVIFFLGDGMGINTLTAARIYAVGEAGELTLDTLPESAFVKTWSNDAQVTDSAASMSAYMTGVKQNNGVISMSGDTSAIAPAADGSSRCTNGSPVPTLLELAKARGLATGIVTTTSVTDATPAATYAHACHRKLQNQIAAMLVPGGAGYNAALGGGVDLVFGGGTQYFQSAANGGKRTDGRDLLTELQSRGYRVAQDTAGFNALAPARQPVVALFAQNDLAYDAERDPARQPSLAEMTRKAVSLLGQRAGTDQGFFLMVEGGLIDHALHGSRAKRALQETAAFDAALKAAIDEVQKIDPGLKHTLIVATADHDHTLLINGYSPRSGPTTPDKPGVLGLVRSLPDGKIKLDKDGAPYAILGFGTGEHRVQGSRATQAGLTDAIVSADDYHQEAAVRMQSETHGGADVYLGAAGVGAELFRGTIDNTRVFTLIKEAAGW